jgi:P-type Ca2+ transporter type 2C
MPGGCATPMAASPSRAESASKGTSPSAHDVRVVHAAVKGRLRLHVPWLRHNPRAARALEAGLSGHAGISSVSASLYTGNILVLFGPDVRVDEVLNLVAGLRVEPGAPVGRRAPFPVREAQPPHRGQVSPAASCPDPAWHALSCDAVLLRLEAAPDGLSADEARRRLHRYGPNELQLAVQRPLADIVAGQFKSIPVLLLIGSSVLSVLTGGLADAAVIVGVIAVNAVIGAYTEAVAERNIQALTRLSAPPVTAARDATTTLVNLSELVPGDIVHVRRGEYVPADARLVASTDLSVAESALTGESAPVSKDAFAVIDERAPLADRVTMLYRGTVVTGGSGVAVVVATGHSTELGRIQALVSEAAQPLTPLQRQLQSLGHQMVLVTVAVSGAMVFIGWLRGYSLLQTVRTAISLAVAAIPEGLPTVSTMTLAKGIRGLRERGLLVRRLDAVETLGAVQIICLDKTGTITANRMAVQAVCLDGRRLRFADGAIRDGGEGEGGPLTDGLTALLRVGALCSDAVVRDDGTGDSRVDGTPTESALVQLALDLGVDVVRLRADYPKVSHLERTEHRMYMSTIHATPEGRWLVATKGRPDQVLSRCRTVVRDGVARELTPVDRSTIETENESMAGQGLRVLGFGYAEVEAESLTDETPLVWAGLLGIADPIRPGIRPLIEAFHRAGIQTVMITGDQSATACAVARAVNLPRAPELEVLDSTGLAGIPDDLLTALASRVDVFSRVSPSNKLQIVRALQRAGLVVAMTGDGINDGPALRASDVGIAMGRGGSELAREVADIVLLDDDVTALVDAIAEGRTTADDIRKSVHFIISTNLSEILLTLGATGLGFGVPLNATQLLWINLLTDVFPELALAVDPAESDVLARPPRPPDTRLIGRRDVPRLTVDATVMAGAGMASYVYGLGRYGANGGAGTMAFQTLTGAQLLHAFSSRSEAHSALDWGRPSNPWLGLSVLTGFGVQLLSTVVPPLRRVLGTVPLRAGDIALSWGLAGGSFVLGEIVKVVAHPPGPPTRDVERPHS